MAKKKKRSVLEEMTQDTVAHEGAHAHSGKHPSLIEKNIKWSQLIYHQNKKIQRRLTFLVIGNYLRLLLVFIPIIIGILYLLPFFGKEAESSADLFRFLRNSIGGGSEIERLIDQIPQQ